ncbi:MAG: DUF4416 family protein [Spirochaetales bacterium]|nr:DUF4416 family protein [Spirochaetales bacterium]
MATAKAFQKCALVMGVLSAMEERRDEILSVLVSHFGPIEMQSPAMDFSFTDYYDNEMGCRPVRYLLLFRDLVDPSGLADLKNLTNTIEKDFSTADGKRKVNLDPGILSLSSFILATCKDRAHRIPLRDGIYAETTLIYKNHDFKSLEWTYADYRSDEIRSVLRSFRDSYKARISKKG